MELLINVITVVIVAIIFTVLKLIARIVINLTVDKIADACEKWYPYIKYCKEDMFNKKS